MDEDPMTGWLMFGCGIAVVFLVVVVFLALDNNQSSANDVCVSNGFMGGNQWGAHKDIAECFYANGSSVLVEIKR